MSERKHTQVNVFHGRRLPEPGTPAGYAALINRYELRVPLPPRLAAVAERSRPRSTHDWQLLTPRHVRPETLVGDLEFALKWEGVDLGVLAALFEAVPDAEVAAIVRASPTGRYARRLWFLHEWLTGRELDLPDAKKVRSVPVVDPDQQFALEEGAISSRHKVRNNLPGTRAFCPLVRRTPELEQFRGMRLDKQAREVIDRTHPDVVRRAAAFLLLDDSRASFEIEGERPSTGRAAQWGRVIGEAGSIELDIDEMKRLQQVVIPDDRFVQMGLRTEGGFVGMHDRRTREPIPAHISARPDDLVDLLNGVFEYQRRALNGSLDAVVVAAVTAFGFVYVHPFEDGNGRLHRWLIHHVLAKARYNPPGVVFPISAAMLRNVAGYRGVLESYARPLLECVEWEPTPDGNVRVLNDTGAYYRFFDATPHAELLYQCVEETVLRDLPGEVSYLEAYDRFSTEVQEVVDLPASTIDLLVRFLEQGEGRLSERARKREFHGLTDEEQARIERLYGACFE